jgi:3-methyladenine DNA glycosylase AlkD
MSAKDLKTDLRKLANKKKAAVLQRFFKTGPGEYGEGDIFLGVTVPQVRKVALSYIDLQLPEIKSILSSDVHEERMCALLLLVAQYKNPDQVQRQRIYSFYIKHVKYINNWDLIDLSCERIVGAYLQDKNKSLLWEWAKDSNHWKRRIAMVSCFAYIKQKEFNDALKVAKILVYDDHDLIQKAVGWMLREIGKRDFMVEEKFLQANYHNMPRTMLRYAIERFPEKLRLAYLRGTI